MSLRRRNTVLRCLLLAGTAFTPALCSAREILYLTNGFTLEATSHSARGEMVIVQTPSGTFEVPNATIDRIDMLADPIPQGSEHLDGATAVVVPKPDLEVILSSAANAQGLTPSFVRSVAKVESNLRQDAISPVGAIGLMQLMPKTAAELGVSPHDAGQNAAGGAQYLRQLLLQYHGDAALALAAYNAGPAAVAKYHGVPPYNETRKYVVRVLQEYLIEQRKVQGREQLLAKASAAKSSPGRHTTARPAVAKLAGGTKAQPVQQLASASPVSGR